MAGTIKIINGDCLMQMDIMEDNSIDSIVTDPPYGLSFMGKKWDYDVPGVDIWKEALRVLKPGGFLLAFAGTRTQHRMAVNIEDAGFEIRDMIAWLYGSGFPKSLDISKQIDKQAGVEREVIGTKTKASSPLPGNHNGTWDDGQVDGEFDITAPATDQAKEWDGWGTALKPCMEPITVARKPLSEKTVASNVLKHGTGGINIDGCRIETDMTKDPNHRPNAKSHNKTQGVNICQKGMNTNVEVATSDEGYHNSKGRWPGNIIHDGSDEVEALFPESDAGIAIRHNSSGNTFGGDNKKPKMEDLGYFDSGSASRFFYCAKASKSDRGKGNNHPTVKPTDLMRWLVRLVTPKNGTCLDMFGGSGTTGKACKLEGFNCILIDDEKSSCEIAQRRIDAILAVQPEIDWGVF